MTEEILAEVDALMDQDSLEVEQIERLRELASCDDDARPRLYKRADDLEIDLGQGGAEGTSLRLGAALFALGRCAAAKRRFEQSKRTKVGSYFLARSVFEMGDYEQAADLFEKAYQISNSLTDAPWLRAEALTLAGKSSEARAVLKELRSDRKNKDRRAYIAALCLEAQGDVGKAIDAYRVILKRTPDHAKTLFRLAFALDRVGEDDDAIKAYEQCVNKCGPFANALINLGVLYEDHGRFQDALICFKQVLARDPYNARAALFLRDARESLDMYYDEEAERKQDKRNRLLEIPITDFELSVRSRNCLERINIRTLGDLTRVTEQELLAYKNFGETSLNEVKAILAQKNLHLGQAVEEGEDPPQTSRGEPPPIPNEVLSAKVNELGLSVRARRCMEWLGIETVGHLINQTERDLLECTNFGQTSMIEVKQKLAALGVSLKPT